MNRFASRKYVAFFRGINVGGNKLVKMETLRKALASNGFQNVKTLLNSGNVVFETTETNKTTLTNRVGEVLKKTFGFDVDVLIRPIEEIQRLVEKNLFNKITLTPQTRLYVTFLSEQSKSNLKIPYESPEKDFFILHVSDSEICSVLIVSKERGTTDAMKILEKEFGRNITTRNWNTILKVLKIVE